MSSTTRRSFLKTGLAAGAVATVGTLPLAAKRTATDVVVLGRSKVEVTVELKEASGCKYRNGLPGSAEVNVVLRQNSASVVLPSILRFSAGPLE